MNRLTRPFFDLVNMNDPVALLVLSYWYALMCHVDFWWTKRRSFRDCIALCMYLEEHGTAAIQLLLEFPASACGFALSRDNKATDGMGKPDQTSRITEVE